MHLPLRQIYSSHPALIFIQQLAEQIDIYQILFLNYRVDYIKVSICYFLIYESNKVLEVRFANFFAKLREYFVQINVFTVKIHTKICHNKSDFRCILFFKIISEFSSKNLVVKNFMPIKSFFLINL